MLQSGQLGRKEKRPRRRRRGVLGAERGTGDVTLRGDVCGVCGKMGTLEGQRAVW